MGERTPAPEPSCGRCIFFDALPTVDAVSVYATKIEEAGSLGVSFYGVCCRFPPVPSDRINREHRDMIDIMGRWPLVSSDQWCGEWKEALV